MSLFNFFWFFFNFEKIMKFHHNLSKPILLILKKLIHSCKNLYNFFNNHMVFVEIFISYRYKISSLDYKFPFFLYFYPYWNLALIKGENPFHLPVLKHRLLK